MTDKVNPAVPAGNIPQPPKQTRITKEVPPVADKVKLACFLVFAAGVIASAYFLGHSYSFSSPAVIASLAVAGAPILVALALMVRQAYLHYQHNREKEQEAHQKVEPQKTSHVRAAQAGAGPVGKPQAGDLFSIQGLLDFTRTKFERTGNLDRELDKPLSMTVFKTTGESSVAYELQPQDQAYASGDFLGAITLAVIDKFHGTGYALVSSGSQSQIDFRYNEDGSTLKSIKANLTFQLKTTSRAIDHIPQNAGQVAVSVDIDVANDVATFHFKNCNYQ